MSVMLFVLAVLVELGPVVGADNKPAHSHAWMCFMVNRGWGGVENGWAAGWINNCCIPGRIVYLH